MRCRLYVYICVRGSTRFRLCRYKISGKPNVFEEFLTTRGYAGGYVIQAV